MSGQVSYKTSLTANDATQQEAYLGIERRTADGKRYRYVLSADTLATGDTVYLSGTTAWKVTKTSAAAPANKVVGVAIGAITAAQYGWVQTGGYCGAVTIASATAVIGTALYGASATTGAVHYATGGTVDSISSNFGTVAIINGASKTSVDAYLNCP